jgi:TatD DNase family protein
MISILQSAYDEKEFKAIIHCYSSSWELAEKALDMGFYISASGMITFPRSEDIRNNFTKIPLDRILVETDSPYLAPVPKRGQVNEPANVVLTAQKMAEIKNVSFDEICEVTTNNFKRLFGL